MTIPDIGVPLDQAIGIAAVVAVVAVNLCLDWRDSNAPDCRGFDVVPLNDAASKRESNGCRRSGA
ncbi:MAG TPA: hypothetical protein VMZ71_02880 [Gemmataceae bacterium]|nr:hypothetical protein [Gemmataceae bacterium]